MPAFLALTQGRNHIAQAAQAAVDVLRLSQSLAGGSALAESLATGQIHQVQRPFAALAGDVVLANKLENEHRV